MYLILHISNDYCAETILCYIQEDESNKNNFDIKSCSQRE